MTKRKKKKKSATAIVELKKRCHKLTTKNAKGHSKKFRKFSEKMI